MSKVELRYPVNKKTGIKATHPTYYYEGKRIPSVTTVIGGNLGWNKQVLMAWQSRLFREGKDPDKVRDEACDVGTLVHNAIEHHIYGAAEIDVSENSLGDIAIMQKGLQSYIQWEKDNRVEYLESEIAMASPSLLVAGTADGIGMVNGKVSLIDFKTSKSLNGEMFIQLAAYREMIHETTDYKIEQCMILHVKKGEVGPGEKRVVEYLVPEEYLTEGLKIFKQLRDLHESNKYYGKYLRKLKKEKR